MTKKSAPNYVIEQGMVNPRNTNEIGWRHFDQTPDRAVAIKEARRLGKIHPTRVLETRVVATFGVVS